MKIQLCYYTANLQEQSGFAHLLWPEWKWIFLMFATLSFELIHNSVEQFVCVDKKGVNFKTKISLGALEYAPAALFRWVNKLISVESQIVSFKSELILQWKLTWSELCSS